MKPDRGTTATNVEGIFAAGDVADKVRTSKDELSKLRTEEYRN